MKVYTYTGICFFRFEFVIASGCLSILHDFRPKIYLTHRKLKNASFPGLFPNFFHICLGEVTWEKTLKLPAQILAVFKNPSARYFIRGSAENGRKRGRHFVHLSENLLSNPVENRANDFWPTFQGPTPSLKTRQCFGPVFNSIQNGLTHGPTK